jgi:hypothetical protein
MPGYGSSGYQGRGRPSGGDIGRGSQPNRPSGSNQSNRPLPNRPTNPLPDRNNQLQADQRKELARTMQQAGMVAGSSISGQGLWKTAPGGTTDPKVLEYLKNPNVYYSTYGKGADAYTTAFQDDLTGYGGLVYSDPNRENYDPYNRGFFTPFNPANYPDQYPGFGGGYNDPGFSTSGDWPGDGGGDGGGGYGGGSIGPAGGPIPQRAVPPGQRLPDPYQQAMINIHGGKGFQQGFARGGIVSLVT